MTPAPIKPSISVDDLDKIDIRVGTILAVENVANSDKLVKLLVEFGDHRRTIVAGMRKERQDPKAEIEGKQALFVVNLVPRKMAGEMSEGCSSTSAMPTRSCRCSLFPRSRSPMERAPVRVRGPLQQIDRISGGRRTAWRRRP